MNRHERRQEEAETRKQGKMPLSEEGATKMLTLTDDQNRVRGQVHVNKTTGQPGIWLYGPKEQPLIKVTATAEGVGYVALFGPRGSVGIDAHSNVDITGADGIQITYKLHVLLEKLATVFSEK
jgi:hypothetical protein